MIGGLSWRRLVIVAVLASVLLAAFVCAQDGEVKRKKFHELTEADIQKLEKEWEKGDEEAELADDFQETHKRKMAEFESRKRPEVKFDPKKPEEFIASHQNPVATSMMFARMTEVVDGRSRTKEDNEKLAMSWNDLLRTGGVITKIYALDEKSLLVSCDGEHASSSKDFILRQPGVDSVSLNSISYYPDGTTSISRGEGAKQPTKQKQKKDKKHKKNKKHKQRKDEEEDGKKKKSGKQGDGHGRREKTKKKDEL